MSKYIVINLNMFAKENQIFIVSPEEEKSEQIAVASIEDMPKVITQLAEETGVYDIKIAGNSKYSQLVEYGILQEEISKYKNRKINIEVI